MIDNSVRLDTDSVEDRERLVIEMMVSLARCLRDERDRLAARLTEVEHELNTLAFKLEPRLRRAP
ncbi:MAG: hypothetical protein HY727_11615 [Candidatus Rokubacteria bacterium]|nr:hypothetical protein [Candidatus Rokubacteria bacterium]